MNKLLLDRKVKLSASIKRSNYLKVVFLAKIYQIPVSGVIDTLIKEAQTPHGLDNAIEAYKRYLAEGKSEKQFFSDFYPQVNRLDEK